MGNVLHTLKTIHPFVYAVIGGGLLLAGLLGYSYYRIHTLDRQLATLQTHLAETNQLLFEETGKLASNLGELDEKASGLAGTLSDAQQSLQNTKNELDNTKSQVAGTAQAVGTLEKLSKTDPELLQKYSKVYFLSENYIPQKLAAIDKTYLYHEARPESIEQRVWPHLKDMLNAAGGAGIKLYVKSAYRSFDEQQSLKNAYTTAYGSGANAFSADQGYSEHQLGTTVDFITSGLGGELEGFEKTTAYAWVQNNAYKYGFILSYPQDNSFYVFEPWHWRYVGVKLSTYLHENGKNFYDLDQRTLDTYLVSIFD